MVVPSDGPTEASRSPTIAAIIPTFRRPHLVRRAILSITAAKIPGLQVRVYDNASGDETATVVRALMERDSRIRYFCHARDIGAVANFQRALDDVDTDFFSLLSDDDVVLPGYYDRALRGFAAHPEVGMVCQQVLLVDSSGGLRPERAMRGAAPGVYRPPHSVLEMATRSPTTWTGIVFRAERGGPVWQFDPAAGSGWDQHFVLRQAALAPYLLLSQPGAIFVTTPLPITRSMRTDVRLFWPGWLRLARDVVSLIDDRDPARAEVHAQLLARGGEELRRLAAAAILRADYDDAAFAIQRLHDDLRWTRQATALQAAARLCRGSTSARHVLLGLWAFRNDVRRGRRRLRYPWAKFEAALAC